MGRIRRATAFAVAATCMATAASGVAFAAPANNDTVTVHKARFVEPGTPGVCDGQPGTLTETVNYVIHTTTGPRIDVTKVNVSSRFTFMYDDPDRPTYTGHYTFSSNSVVNTGGTVDKTVLNSRAVGSDGSTETFHLNTVFVVSPDGTVRSQVVNVFCKQS